MLIHPCQLEAGDLGLRCSMRSMVAFEPAKADGGGSHAGLLLEFAFWIVHKMPLEQAVLSVDD